MQYSPRYTAGDIFAESRRWEDLHGNNVTSDLLNAVDPLRPLRIGYVSSDFRRHSVSYFLRALFANHSRTEFRIYCYSDVSEPDEYTSYFRTASDGWRDISGLGDNEVARMVSEDAIDILVDLAAHTGDRLTLFTRRLAPVQVTWLGYPGTSGLSTIDYRISDDIADPPGESDRFNSERVYRLPDGFLCYTPPVDTPGIAPLPSAASAQITFGSFNSIAKITPEVVGLWSKVLHNNPESRLIIKTFSLSDGATRKRYTELFTANGIDIERVELRPWERNTTSHLAVYGEVDIALDTFPYNGTTTTCESLWMGVPVVTLSGERHSARVGTSILSRVGLDDLVAATPDEYLRITENLARDKERLIQLRQTLRKKMQASPLSDGAAFTGHMEKAFRRMWGDWCLQKSQ
jgi:predicted O-linked N-acetylglucosamine transferase (SPINDLY family)